MWVVSKNSGDGVWGSGKNYKVEIQDHRKR